MQPRGTPGIVAGVQRFGYQSLIILRKICLPWLLRGAVFEKKNFGGIAVESEESFSKLLFKAFRGSAISW